MDHLYHAPAYHHPQPHPRQHQPCGPGMAMAATSYAHLDPHPTASQSGERRGQSTTAPRPAHHPSPSGHASPSADSIHHPSPVPLPDHRPSVNALSAPWDQQQPSSGPVRRKQNSACDRCRMKKIKCEWRIEKDGENRSCDMCIKHNKRGECTRWKSEKALARQAEKPRPGTRTRRATTVVSESSLRAIASTSVSPSPAHLALGSARSSFSDAVSSWGASPSPSAATSSFFASPHAGSFSSSASMSVSTVPTPAGTPAPSSAHGHWTVPLFSPSQPHNVSQTLGSNALGLGLGDDGLVGHLAYVNAEEPQRGGGDGEVEVEERKVYRVADVLWAPVAVKLEGYGGKDQYVPMAAVTICEGEGEGDVQYSLGSATASGMGVTPCGVPGNMDVEVDMPSLATPATASSGNTAPHPSFGYPTPQSAPSQQRQHTQQRPVLYHLDSASTSTSSLSPQAYEFHHYNQQISPLSATFPSPARQLSHPMQQSLQSPFTPATHLPQPTHPMHPPVTTRPHRSHTVITRTPSGELRPSPNVVLGAPPRTHAPGHRRSHSYHGSPLASHQVITHLAQPAMTMTPTMEHDESKEDRPAMVHLGQYGLGMISPDGQQDQHMGSMPIGQHQPNTFITQPQHRKDRISVD